MRQIEFRALNAKKDFVYGWLVCNIKPVGERMIVGTMEIHQPYGDWNEETEVYDDTVGQSTGLKDCNGVKIFEGDIVESSIFICPLAVYYNEDLAMYRLTAGGNSDDGDFIQYEGSVFKVIGNIHQNPELLK